MPIQDSDIGQRCLSIESLLLILIKSTGIYLLDHNDINPDCNNMDVHKMFINIYV